MGKHYLYDWGGITITMTEFNSTDKKIIKATFDILQKEGVTKTTTKKIAAEAGVNEVTIFRKFQNKKNLVEITKECYLQRYLDKMEEIFDFDEDFEIEDYLQSNFIGILNLPDEDSSIVRLALEEVRDTPERKQLISRITGVIMDKLDEFFQSQIEKGKIREVNTRVLAGMCFSITFQSAIFWKIYDIQPNVETKQYSENFLDILYNGIKA